MVDGSASKPAFRQDTGYMVEKTYLDIALYLQLVIFLIFQKKNLNIDIWVPKMLFYKMYVFGAPIESEGPGMVSLHGLEKIQFSLITL